MKKILLGTLIGVIILGVAGVVAASMLIPAADQAEDNAKAPDNSPVIDIGSGEDWLASNSGLDRVDFIHYVRPANPGKPATTATCYKLLGVKWSTLPVAYAINPANSGLLENFVTTAISTSAETWDDATASELFNDNYTIDNDAQYGVQDYKNAIAFGDYPNSNVIAVTSIWYTRIGKKIVEFDILFNTDFAWGDADTDATKMDLQNIATHELGHGAGLGDLYSSSCAEVTMYGYSVYGEIKKRILEQPDINGIQKLYGGL